MEDEKEKPAIQPEAGRIVNPKTGLPFGEAPKNATTMVEVPINQSCVVIPSKELQLLKSMQRHQRRAWAANKKKKLGWLIDQYVRQAAMPNNGTPQTPKEEDKK